MVMHIRPALYHTGLSDSSVLFFSVDEEVHSTDLASALPCWSVVSVPPWERNQPKAIAVHQVLSYC